VSAAGTSIVKHKYSTPQDRPNDMLPAAGDARAQVEGIVGRETKDGGRGRRAGGWGTNYPVS
jgi:hypothetical protein